MASRNTLGSLFLNCSTQVAPPSVVLKIRDASPGPMLRI
jgi:hypothetical protein